MIEYTGTIIQKDFKAKEKVLRNIISAKDSEITVLNNEIKILNDAILNTCTKYGEVAEELRALKAKERRRAYKKKKGKEQDVGA